MRVRPFLVYEKKNRASQHGAVLIVSLIILLVMTLLGLSSMQSSMLEEMMSGNVRDHNLAFQAAEAGLRDADAWLFSLTSPPEPDAPATFNVYMKGTLGDIDSTIFDWDNQAIGFGSLVGAGNQVSSCAPTTSPPAGHVLEGLSALPCFTIEEYDFIPDDLDPDTLAKKLGRHYYRITARGFGGTDASMSIIQTILYQRYN